MLTAADWLWSRGSTINLSISNTEQHFKKQQTENSIALLQVAEGDAMNSLLNAMVKVTDSRVVNEQLLNLEVRIQQQLFIFL